MPSSNSAASKTGVTEPSPLPQMEKEDTKSKPSTITQKKSSWFPKLDPPNAVKYWVNEVYQQTGNNHIWPHTIKEEIDSSGNITIKTTFLIDTPAGSSIPRREIDISAALSPERQLILSMPITGSTINTIADYASNIATNLWTTNASSYTASDSFLYQQYQVQVHSPVGLSWVEHIKEAKRWALRQQIISKTPKNHHGKTARAEHADFSSIQPNEIKALQLLRKMVSPEQFRKYLKTGYLSYRANSGLTYVVRHRQAHVLVYKAGKKVCELCVVLDQGDIPPTDAVITKLLMAKFSETSIWKSSNIYWVDGLPRINRHSFEEHHLKQLAA